MKKKIISLFAAAVMTLAASSAFAAFADLELIRVSYTASNEYATDLGNVQTLINNGGTFAAYGSGLYTTYYAVDTSNLNMYASINQLTGTPASDVASIWNSAGNLGVVSANYATNAGGASSVTIPTTNVQSYFATFIGNPLSSGLGVYGGATTTLCEVANGTTQTQGLYFYDMNALFSGTASSVDWVKVANITTNADGSTIVTTDAPTTPIPAAAWLLGSGLLGLFGIRRKQK